MEAYYVVTIGIGTCERASWGPFPSRRTARRWMRKHALTAAWVEDAVTFAVMTEDARS